MGPHLDGMGGASYVSFCVAIAIVALGLVLAIRIELGKTEGDPAGTRLVVFSIVMAFYSVIVGWIGIMYSRSLSLRLGATANSTSEADLLLIQFRIDGEKQLQIAQVILLATLGLLAPLLVSLWNSFNKDYLDELRYLGGALSRNTAQKNRLEKCLHNGKMEYNAVQTLGRVLQIPYYIVLGILCLALCLVAITGAPRALALTVDGVRFYFAVGVLVRFLAEAALLLFLFLLMIHMLLVQRSLGVLRRDSVSFD